MGRTMWLRVGSALRLSVIPSILLRWRLEEWRSASASYIQARSKMADVPGSSRMAAGAEEVVDSHIRRPAAVAGRSLEDCTEG